MDSVVVGSGLVALQHVESFGIRDGKNPSLASACRFILEHLGILGFYSKIDFHLMHDSLPC